MNTISFKGAREAKVNNELATLLDRNINYEPVKVELVTEIKESTGKSKMLGAILLFPSVAKNGDKVEDRKHWISFDNLFTTTINKELFNKFYDNSKAMFLGLSKLGVKNGQAFLANS
jgi:hypothetical protein